MVIIIFFYIYLFHYSVLKSHVHDLLTWQRWLLTEMLKWPDILCTEMSSCGVSDLQCLFSGVKQHRSRALTDNSVCSGSCLHLSHVSVFRFSCTDRAQALDMMLSVSQSCHDLLQTCFHSHSLPFLFHVCVLCLIAQFVFLGSS